MKTSCYYSLLPVQALSLVTRSKYWIAVPTKMQAEFHKHPAQHPITVHTRAFCIKLLASSVGGVSELQAIIK